jgi:hypothetical protein
MAIKKSELYSSLWSSCDELRGGMDASQYKDYVLVLLFIKYVSDKYAGQTYAPITIPKGASFRRPLPPSCDGQRNVPPPIATPSPAPARVCKLRVRPRPVDTSRSPRHAAAPNHGGDQGQA